MPATTPHRRPVRHLVLGMGVVVALLAGACGSGSTKRAVTDDAGLTPKRGGKVVYGLEAETVGGYCLPDAQLVISGIQVARSIYDTLTVPNADGGYSPYLAEQITHDGAFQTWTVKLRPGITFHDGSPLDADVVRDNLNAYRGLDPNHPALLFRFVFSNIADVTSDGALTVTITTKVPWVDLPAFLFSGGRVGIIAKAQLDSGKDACAHNPIGTGPFQFRSWVVNDRLIAVRNPNYWLKAPDGKPYPYLDEVEYRPVTETSVRQSELDQGELTVAHLYDPITVAAMEQRQAEGRLRVTTSTKLPEVTYLLLNSSKAPFDDRNVRAALAYGLDRKHLSELNGSHGNIASGPFGPGVVGNLGDTGFPATRDLPKAKKLIADYKAAHGGAPVSFTMIVTTDPQSLAQCEEMRKEAAEFGVEIEVQALGQSELVNTAISGDYQAMFFRNHQGGDPDQQYVWWYGIGNPVNFGRFNDAEVNRLLDAGRSEPDQAKRVKIYEDLNRRFGSEHFNIWLTYVNWAVATSVDVHGVLGPNLPDGSKPSPSLALGNAMTGMWVG